MSSTANWTEKQQQCIHSHKGTLLVSAAAGSGKTSVLIEHILERITDPDTPVDIDHLLVVTFTKAAAAEMKQRLSVKLAEKLANNPHDRHLQRQQLILPRANICTVDAFCTTLLRENFHLLELSPQFHIADNTQTLLLRQEALTETIADCYRNPYPGFSDLVALLSNGRNDTQLSAAIEEIYDFIQSHPHPARWLANMGDLYDTDIPIVKTVWCTVLFRYIRQAVENCLTMYKKAVRLCDSNEVLTEKYLPSLQKDICTLNALLTNTAGVSWDTLASQIRTFGMTALSPIRKGTDEAVKEQIQQLRKTIQKQMDNLRKIADASEEDFQLDLVNSGQLIRALYEAVHRFSLCYSEKKKKNNLLDFSDVEHESLRLLTRSDDEGNLYPTPLADDLSAQFEEILVDEYQDTNAVQDALFSALSRGESNLFFVGDVKQSIYGFRQAMPELFLGRRAAYPEFDGITYPGTVTLGNNFRSRREVTDSVNFFFRQLMSEELGGLQYDEKEELVCSAPYSSANGYQTECLIVDSHNLPDDLPDGNAAEARIVAQRIRDMVGTFTVTDKHGTRPAQYRDFCILLRNRKGHAVTYQEELERQGIPVCSQSDAGFYNAAEIRLTLSLLRAIDNPRLDIPLTAVMLSPLFAFSPDDMAAIRPYANSCLFAAIGLAARRDPNKQLADKCLAFLNKLRDYRTLAAQLTVDQLLCRLYDDTLLPELLCSRSDGERRLDNLRLLHDLCRRFDKNGFRGLTAFITYSDRLKDDESFLPKTTSSAGNAVQILSVHGSKGLEFPIVFLAGLGGRFNREDSHGDLLLHPHLGAGIRYRDPVTYNKYATLPYLGISLANRNSTCAEELRVLYVAMTRAREKLFLVMNLAHPETNIQKQAAMLTEQPVIPPFSLTTAESMSDWILAALLRHPSSKELRHIANAENLPVLPAETDCIIRFSTVTSPPDVQNDVTAPPTADPETVSLLQEHITYTYPHAALATVPAKMAASVLAHGAIQHGQAARSRPAFISKTGLTPAERGTALHLFMQFANYPQASVNLDEEIRRLITASFLTTEQAESLDKAKLSAFFLSSLYTRMTCADRCLREYRFTFRKPASDIQPNITEADESLVIQGIADCLFIEDNSIIVVDYKTDYVQSAAELCDRYRPQLAIYREALSRLLELPVRECLLYSFTLNQTIPVTFSE